MPSPAAASAAAWDGLEGGSHDCSWAEQKGACEETRKEESSERCTQAIKQGLYLRAIWQHTHGLWLGRLTLLLLLLLLLLAGACCGEGPSAAWREPCRGESVRLDNAHWASHMTPTSLCRGDGHRVARPGGRWFRSVVVSLGSPTPLQPSLGGCVLPMARHQGPMVAVVDMPFVCLGHAPPGATHRRHPFLTPLVRIRHTVAYTKNGASDMASMIVARVAVRPVQVRGGPARLMCTLC